MSEGKEFQTKTGKEYLALRVRACVKALSCRRVYKKKKKIVKN